MQAPGICCILGMRDDWLTCNLCTHLFDRGLRGRAEQQPSMPDSLAFSTLPLKGLP